MLLPSLSPRLQRWWQLTAFLFATIFGVLSGPTALAIDLERFLKEIISEDNEIRFAARRGADQVGAAAIPHLGKLMTDGRREVALTARAAMEVIVHDAGRSDTPEKAKIVAAELAKLLRASTSLTVKREVLHLIAFIGTDEVVPAVASQLAENDRHVREAARLTLEEIPGDAAVIALIDAARNAENEHRSDFVFSLGKKSNSMAVPFLVENTAHENSPVRFAAFQALARLGATTAVPRFQAAIRDAGSPIRTAVFNEFMRLADQIEKLDPDLTESIYREVLTTSPADYQRERALHRLAPAGNADNLESLLTSLSDRAARVRALAVRRLSKLEGKQVTDRLRAAYASAVGEKRAFLLRAIASRDPENAGLLIKSASSSADPEIKITALDLQDQLLKPGLESTYLDVARTGSASVRPTALKAYLVLARDRLASAKATRKASAVMFVRALELAADESQRIEAILGLDSVGETDVVETLVPYLSDPAVGADASRVFVNLSEKLVDEGKLDVAEPLLTRILTDNFPHDLKVRASDKLKAAGRDPQASAHAQGFVLDWWLIGPIHTDGRNPFEVRYFPEEKREFEGIHNIGARRYRWQRPRLLTTTGGINLLPLFRRSQRRVAYAYTELNSTAEQDVLFKMGSDDGIACWLNDTPIHTSPGKRGMKFDQDLVPARLVSGKNRVLLKIANGGGDWAFAFRITDVEGIPLPLESALD